MFVEGFNLADALSAARCPRCLAVGLVGIDAETYEDAPIKDRHMGGPVVSPSAVCRCPSCGLVAEWPGCCPDEG